MTDRAPQDHRDVVWDAVLETLRIYQGLGVNPTAEQLILQFDCMRQNDRHLKFPLLYTHEQFMERYFPQRANT